MLNTKIGGINSVVEILLFTVGIAITLGVLMIVEGSYYQYKNVNSFLESNKNINIKYQLDSNDKIQFDRDDEILSDGIRNTTLHDDLDLFFSSMNTLGVDIKLPPGYISQDIFNKNMYMIEFYNQNIRDIPNYQTLINSIRSNKYVVGLLNPTYSPLDTSINKFIIEFK